MSVDIHVHHMSYHWLKYQKVILFGDKIDKEYIYNPSVWNGTIQYGSGDLTCIQRKPKRWIHLNPRDILVMQGIESQPGPGENMDIGSTGNDRKFAWERIDGIWTNITKAEDEKKDEEQDYQN